MIQSFVSLEPLLVAIVLAILAVGLPVLLVMSIRFMGDRRLNIGRSKEFEKLIWQLHRIATALEHQLNLSFPAVQPGTEEPRDLAYLQPITPPPNPAAATASDGTASAVATATNGPEEQEPVTSRRSAQQISVLRAPAEGQRGGVNSMFGL